MDAFHIHTCPEWNALGKEQYIIALSYLVDRHVNPFSGPWRQGGFDLTTVDATPRDPGDTTRKSDLDRLKDFEMTLFEAFIDGQDSEAGTDMVKEFQARLLLSCC